jgi:hypothetical protein
MNGESPFDSSFHLRKTRNAKSVRGRGSEEPVDRAVALKRNPPGSWKMPVAPLYRRLLEKCQGRVVHSDIGWADDAKSAQNKPVEKEFTGMATPAEWSKWKQSQAAATNITISPKYVDFVLN